jgi:O-antigen/teichoic acid export membrane protein
MFLRGTRYATAVSLPVIVAAFVFAGPLIRTWLGDGLGAAIGPTRLFLAYLAVIVVNNVGSTMLVALGRELRLYISVVVFDVLLNLVLSIILVHPLGISGVVLGTVIGNAAIAPILLRIFLRQFGVSLGEWTREVAVPMLPGLVVQGVTAAPLLWAVEQAESLPVVAAAGILSVAGSLAAFALVGMRRPERAVLAETLRAALGLGIRTPAPE